MIRINLVAPERTTKAKAKGPSLPAGALQSYLLLALFAGGALVLCAGAWWLQSNKLNDLATRIAADEKRERDLQAIKQQVDQFQQKEGGAREQGPRHRAAAPRPEEPRPHAGRDLEGAARLRLADRPWTRPAAALRFQGQSNSLAAVADFISGLQRSGWFPQVDLGSSQEQRNLVNFTVTGTFRDPEVAAKEKAAADARAAAEPPPTAKAKRGRK
jgi:Tfp pilus assembly protein PilN